ncbi:unnamed protein product [Leptosia nina]|uniref:Uncharacterized protein n=1 Tax=Leptosia nina TaxID=320188 RepID=A0AAV1JXD5_9NEOP
MSHETHLDMPDVDPQVQEDHDAHSSTLTYLFVNTLCVFIVIIYPGIVVAFVSAVVHVGAFLVDVSTCCFHKAVGFLHSLF